MSSALIPQSITRKVNDYFAAGLQRQAAGTVADTTGFRLSVPRKRFKEGFISEDQFEEELRSLYIPEDQIPLEIIAGKLDYAYDYTMDLISAWRDGVRKGNISIDKYREYLTGIGIVEQKVLTYVLREVVRQKSSGEPGIIAPVTPAYLTDAGKVQVDTLRRQRRKSIISRDEEVAGLLELGMPAEEASSIADNDDVRMPEKKGAEQ